MTMTSSVITEKRLKNEMKELLKNRLEFAQAIQDEDDKFIFYFLLKGDKDSDYNGGYYLGKIMLPHEYPAKPGDFMTLTPNGRFEINKKICLTNSGYHTESWTPTWNIKNMIIGFSSIFNTDLEHGISHIKDTPANRRKFAKESVDYNNSYYKNIFVRFDQFVNSDGTIKENQELTNEKAPKKKKKEESVSKEEEIIVISKEDNKEEAKKENIVVQKEAEQPKDVIVVPDKKTESLNKHKPESKLDGYIAQIANMKYENFAIDPFTNASKCISVSLSEL